MVNVDGLFKIPYSAHDWMVLSFALAGTAFRIYLMYKTPDIKNPAIKEWVGISILSFILTVGLYELALFSQWKIEKLYLPFALIIVIAKDVIDWLFMSKEGKSFLIETVKTIVSVLVGKLGYQKIEQNEENNSNN